MRTAVLFSGGKDSTLALYYAKEFSQVACLISIQSENPESYMFHTPNINLVEKQAEAIGIPAIIQKTKGIKEEELDDLKTAILQAIHDYGIEGIVTGAVESVYQASRVQTICDDLHIECFNPLWQKDQFAVLHDLVILGFEVMIIGVFAEGFDKSWLGRIIDANMIVELQKLHNKFFLNPSFEGGEAETIVLFAPFFKKRLRIKKAKKMMYTNNSGIYQIEELVFDA